MRQSLFDPAPHNNVLLPNAIAAASGHWRLEVWLPFGLAAAAFVVAIAAMVVALAAY